MGVNLSGPVGRLKLYVGMYQMKHNGIYFIYLLKSDLSFALDLYTVFSGE